MVMDISRISPRFRPLWNGLIGAAYPGAGMMKNLVNNEDLVLVDTDSTLYRPTQFGPGVHIIRDASVQIPGADFGGGTEATVLYWLGLSGADTWLTSSILQISLGYMALFWYSGYWTLEWENAAQEFRSTEFTTAGGFFADDQASHVLAASRKGTVTKLYGDGQLKETGSTGSDAFGPRDLKMGSDYDASWSADVVYHACLAWDRVLTDEEVRLVSEDPFGMIRPVRRAYIPAIEGYEEPEVGWELPAITSPYRLWRPSVRDGLKPTNWQWDPSMVDQEFQGMASKLVSGWLFNDDETLAHSFGKSPVQGTYTNGAYNSVGPMGKTAVFDGDNDYIELGTIPLNHPLQLSSGGTGIIVTKPTLAGDNYFRWIDKSNNANGLNGWALCCYNSGNLMFRADGWVDATSDSQFNITANTWWVVGFTWNANEHPLQGGSFWAKPLYGGTMLTDLTMQHGALANVATNARIGTWNHSTAREFQGELAAVLMFDGEFTNAEMTALMEDPFGPVRPARIISKPYRSQLSVLTNDIGDEQVWKDVGEATRLIHSIQENVKPEPWALEPSLVDLKWNWFWNGNTFVHTLTGSGPALNVTAFRNPSETGPVLEFYYDTNLRAETVDPIILPTAVPRTIMAFARITNLNEDYGALMAYGFDNSDGGWGLQLHRYNKSIIINDHKGVYTDVGAVVEGGWAVYAWASTAGNAHKVYCVKLGGEVVANATSTTWLALDAPSTHPYLRIGVDSTVTPTGWWDPFYGQISWVAVLDQALSLEQVVKIAEDPFGPIRPARKFVPRYRPTRGRILVPAPNDGLKPEAW